jgi:hypothetical protein
LGVLLDFDDLAGGMVLISVLVPNDGYSFWNCYEMKNSGVLFINLGVLSVRAPLFI